MLTWIDLTWCFSNSDNLTGNSETLHVVLRYLSSRKKVTSAWLSSLLWSFSSDHRDQHWAQSGSFVGETDEAVRFSAVSPVNPKPENSELLSSVTVHTVDNTDPVPPNLLLMGRLEASLPQAVFHDTELLSNHRWHHNQVPADHFWIHFIKSQLPNLQQRQK